LPFDVGTRRRTSSGGPWTASVNSLCDLPDGAPSAVAQGSDLPDAGHAPVTLLAYTLLFSGLAMWHFRSRDATAN